MIAGFIFGCNNDTLDECLDRKLFGVPLNFFSQEELNEIKPGIPLFLFNYSTRVFNKLNCSFHLLFK